MIFRPELHAPGGQRAPRRGVILIVVLALLTLFAIMGLAFATYSGAEATSSRIWKEAGIRANERDLLRDAAAVTWNMFLGQSLYGVPENDQNFVLSALWGHDLARNMYGWNPAGLNDKPYVGTGRLRENFAGPPAPPFPFPPETDFLVNYMPHQADNFIRYPGRLGYYVHNGGSMFPPNRDVNNPLTGDLHVSYTFPDHNNMYLAQVDIVTTPGPDLGKPIVRVPSYHRDWVANARLGVPADPGWTAADGRYRLMRPRPVDHPPVGNQPGFPAIPINETGDVKNLDFAAGGNDSIWMDIGAPVMTGPDGTRFKAMIAPLILDLDGRINLNVVGNLLLNRNWTGPPAPDLRDSASSQGWGPWEVNPKRVLDWPPSPAPPNPPLPVVEWRNIFVGDPNLGLQGRYGPSQKPEGPPGIQGGTALRRYFPIDYNAITETAGEIEYTPNNGTPVGVGPYSLTPRWSLPGEPAIPGMNAVPMYQAFPQYSNWGYNNARPLLPRTLGETQFPNAATYNHPDQFNALRPFRASAAQYNKTFGTTDLIGLLRRMNVGGDQVASDLLRLVPNNLEGPANAFRRNRVTTHSMDVDRPGSPPYIYNADFVYPPVGGAGQPRYSRPSVLAGQGFPALAQRPLTPATGSNEFTQNWTSCIGQQDFRSPWGYVYRAGLRIDLSRKLTPYPVVDTNTWLYRQQPADIDQLNKAALDRQNLAWEIYTTLWQLCGAESYTTMVAKAANDPSVRAHRWLAQLAVNLVDFIDGDDTMTVMPWRVFNNVPDVVVGTELPRLVINEYYAQWDNDQAVAGMEVGPNRRVNVWAELHNPFPPENAFNDPAQGAAVLQRPGAAGEPIYRLQLTRSPNAAIRDPENALGDPGATDPIDGLDAVVGRSMADPAGGVADWGTVRSVDPNYALTGPAYTEGGTPTRNKGFYVVGSNWTYANAAADPGLSANASHTTDRLTYTRPRAEDPINPANNAGTADIRPALLLRRLANPYLPFQNNPAQANYNPYVTVDYVEQVRVTNGLLYDNGVQRQYNVVFTAADPRAAWGRNQPFAAWLNPAEDLTATPANEQNWRRQDPDSNTNVFDLRHTFFRHNAKEANPPATGPSLVNNTIIPAEALAHIDRQPTSVAELLHVSGFRPHELTQQFANYVQTAAGPPPTFQRVPHGHIAPWDGNAQRLTWADPTVRVHRLLEYLTVGSRAAGIASHGRMPGKVNINTVWDKAVFDAIADAYAPAAAARPNRFHQADVDAIWSLIVASRRNGQPLDVTAASKPFWGLATGLNLAPPAVDPMTPGQRRGVVSTLLRPSALRTQADQMVLEPQLPTVPGPPPVTPPLPQALQRTELLSKIMGHLTTRSNVFGMWTTIGFFRVLDETTKPVRLGAEVNWPNSGQVRIRTFALIDRTQLQVWPTYNDAGAATVRYDGPNITLPPTVPNGPPQTAVPGVIALVDANNQPVSAPGTFVQNPNTGFVWALWAGPNAPLSGAVLTFDPDTDNEETVVVRFNAAAVPPRHEATFTKPHARGAVVISRGNPGPWLSYDPTKDIGVIMHQEIFD